MLFANEANIPHQFTWRTIWLWYSRYLLKPEPIVEHKYRLAFAKAHANEMWQADTMVGPYVENGAGKTQARPIAFIDDASRVCFDGEFFLAENTDTLIQALQRALYERGVPESMYVDFFHGTKSTYNAFSQLGDRTTTDSSIPVTVSGF